MRQPGIAPKSRLSAGLAQHPGAERHDQPAALCQRDEFSRRHRAKSRVPPPCERFGADDPACAELALRLKFQHQLATLERPPEIAFELFARLDLGAHLGGVETKRVAPLRLGSVQRHVGGPQQLALIPTIGCPIAMPRLVVACIFWRSSRKGLANTCMAFRATAAASSGRRISVRIKANSSPPRRATVSLARTHASSLRATSTSN
jgi:hypothetical protein